MAKLIHLPKKIRTDPRLKQVFGSQQRVESKPTPKGYGSWQAIRQAWVRKQPSRICKNPNCKRKEYYPQNSKQLYCSNSCYLDVHRKRKQAVPTTCSACGRHSRFLHDGLCSFCFANHRKAIFSAREEKKSGLNRCRNCGSTVKRNISPQLFKFKLCSMCFGVAFPRPECPKCGYMSNVRLSLQISSEPNIVIWFCHACDYVFPKVIKNVRKKV